MGILHSLKSGARALFHKVETEREMDEELRGFVDASVADKMRGGASAEEATRAARVEMGSTNAVKHQIRSAGWEAALDIFLQDLRQCVRSLWHTPGFTLVAVLSLGLGIGANTAIFTLIRQILLQNLPVREPEKLVTFGESIGGGILGGIDLGEFDQYTYDFAQQLAAKPGPFEGVAAYCSFSPKVSVRLPNTAGAIEVNASPVSGNFFNVLGATPLLGRTLIPADAEAPHRNAVAVISHHFWQQALNGDAAIVGKTISINGTPFTVVGVMPEAFHGIRQELEPPDVWTPLTMAQEMMQADMDTFKPRSLYYLHMVARRSAQASLAADQNWLNQQVRNYVKTGEGAKITPDRMREIERLTVRLVPGGHGVSMLRNQYGESLKILMGVVGVVLLIACANLANFLLARTVARQREIATRLALGSSRARIMRQGLMEALLLSLTGGLVGLVIAFAATRALIAFVAEDSAYTPLSSVPDAEVLLFTLGLSLLAGVVFGLAPAIRAARSSAGPGLSANTRTALSGGGRGGRFWPKALVTAQIMLSLLLLVGAGLFLRTLRNLQDQDYGFERTHLLIAEFDAHLAGYTPEQIPGLNERLLERLNAIPGVRSAALSGAPPISFGSWRSSISLSGYVPQPKEDMGSTLNRVSGRYFETAGIAMVAGRAIGPQDTVNSMKVAVINETIAHKFFPHGDALGHMLTINIDTVKGPWQIVGVMRDTRANGPRSEVQRMVDIPLAQIVGPHGEGIGDSYVGVMLLRTAGDPAHTINDLRSAVSSVDPNLPILQVRTIQEHLETMMGREELITRLTVLFAGLALVLACIGLYGVMSFNVARRSNEIGIRLALGATGGGMQWMVLRETLMLLAAGVALGLPLALTAAHLVRAALYSISPFDPAIVGGAVAVIAVVTALAAWLPARRAAAVDPMVALRCE